MAEDIISNENFTVSLLPGEISVGRVKPEDLQGCAWPLLKAMFGSGADNRGPAGFFSLTQETSELTLLMDERCRAAFDEASAIAMVEYAPHRWRVLELNLGSLAWEVPGLVCFLATLMAESKVSILNLSSNDRDFLLVQDSDIETATRVIQERLQHDAVGLKDAISEKAMVRRSGTWSAPFDDVVDLLEAENAKPSVPVNTSMAACSVDGTDGHTCAVSTGPNAGPSGSFRLPAMPRRNLSDGELNAELFVKVLPATLVVVRLQRSMLQASMHALVQRMLFCPSEGGSCFWSYTQCDDEVRREARKRCVGQDPVSDWARISVAEFSVHV